MPETLADPLLDALVNDFGGNYVFALDLLEQYRRDRARSTRAGASTSTASPGAPPSAESADSRGPRCRDAGRAGPRRLARRGHRRLRSRSCRAEPQAVAAAPERRRRWSCPPSCPATSRTPIRGGAMRIVENMEASLTVPTATSMRTIPVRTLEENRRILNKHRDATGAGKVSFTHLVAWAILRALDTFPRLNDAYAELEGQPHRIQRDAGAPRASRSTSRRRTARARCSCPNIKDAGTLDFAAFLQAFDDLVARARKGTISPDDFMGTTVSLTNPGTVGTTASAPRLMPGQGLIVATGALDYPAEYRSMAPRTLSLLGHQQGHDGDLDLRPPHHPGRGVGPVPGAHGGAAPRARTASTSASSRT